MSIIFRSFNCLAAIFGIVAIVLSTPAKSQDVDLEIVLAVDGSGSINFSDFKLQLAGYAAAFRDPTIQAAATSGPIGRIAVALMVWSDAAFRKYPTEWHVIASPGNASRFAHVVENFYLQSDGKVPIGGGGTGIGAGVAYAMQMLDNNNITGLRRVIDVSGDGIETEPRFRKYITLPDVTEAVDQRGITINGLVILTDFPRLDEWYRANVVRGPGSFVVIAKQMSNFAEAIHNKLFREFSHEIAGTNNSPIGNLAFRQDRATGQL